MILEARQLTNRHNRKAPSPWALVALLLSLWLAPPASAEPILTLDRTPLGDGLVAWQVGIVFDDGESRSAFVDITLEGAFQHIEQDGTDINGDAEAAAANGSAGYEAARDSYFITSRWPDAVRLEGGGVGSTSFRFAGGSGALSQIGEAIEVARLVAPIDAPVRYTALVSRGGESFELIPEPSPHILGLAAATALAWLVRRRRSRWTKALLVAALFVLSPFATGESHAGDFDLPADANRDGEVDADDYAIWRSHYGDSGASGTPGDFNGDGEVDGADYTIWADSYGTTVGGGLDPRVFVLLDAEGEPVPGSQVEPDAEGNLPPFALRVGGEAAASLGIGLSLRFPAGARLLDSSGSEALAGASLPEGLRLSFTDVAASFGDDFPIQLKDELLRTGGNPVGLLAGSISVGDLATLFGRDPLEGLEFVLLDQFDFTSTLGFFEPDGSIDLAIPDLRFSDQACLLGGAVSVLIDPANPGGELELGGDAGLFPNSGSVSDCSGLLPEDFQIGVEGFGAAFDLYLDGFDMRFESGALVLDVESPFETGNSLFETNICPDGGEGPRAELDPGDLALVFDSNASPGLTFEGDVLFQNLGLPLPDVDGLDVALCETTLHFTGIAAPQLVSATGVTRWETPHFLFDATLIAEGFDLSGRPTGSLDGAGGLQLLAADFALSATLTYDIDTQKYGVSAALVDDDYIVVADNAVLFDGAVELVGGASAPTGAATISGTLGFFGASASAGNPKLEDFSLRLEGLEAQGAFAPGFLQLSLTAGSLLLPDGVFRDPEACGLPGSAEASPVAVSFAVPPTITIREGGFELDGGLDAAGLAFGVPGIDGLQLTLCSADLAFSGSELPVFENVSAALDFEEPGVDLHVDVAVESWPLGALPTGAAASALSGSGRLVLSHVVNGTGDPVDVEVEVAFEPGTALFRFDATGEGLAAMDLGPQARVFGAGLSLSFSTAAPVGALVLSGDAGFFPRVADPASPGDFEVGITGLVARADYDPSALVFTLEEGALGLPADIFSFDDSLCNPPGGPVEGSLDAADADPALSLTIAPGELPSLAGSLAVANLLVEMPGVEGFQANLCSATLSFAGSSPPVLTDIDAAFSYLQDDLALDGRFAVPEWNLAGLPSQGFSGEAGVVLQHPSEPGESVQVTGTFAFDPGSAGSELAFTSSAGGLESFRISDQAVIFNSAMGIVLSTTAPDARVRIAGDAGLLLRDDFAGGVPDFSDYQLTVAGFDASLDVDPEGFLLTFAGGQLALPEWFAADPGFCDPASSEAAGAVQIDLAGGQVGTPLSIDLHSGVLTLAGSLGVSDVVFQAPEFMGLQVGLCSANLAFSGGLLPEFTDLAGAVALAIPDAADPDLRVRSTLSVGAWGFDGLPRGGVAGTGTLELVEPGAVFDVGLCYSTGCTGVSAPSDVLRFEGIASDLQNLLYSDWLAIFNAGASLELARGGTQGRIELGGAAGFEAGLIARPDAPASDREKGDYQLAVTDLGASLAFDAAGFVVEIDGGDLLLPDFFTSGLLDGSTCVGAEGASSAPVLSGAGLRVSFPAGELPSVTLDTSFSFSNIGLEVPGIEGLAAELCTATLSLDDSLGFPAPVLTNLAGAVELPLPTGDSNDTGPIRLAINNTDWDLLGFPTGRVELVDDLSVLSIEGFEVAATGSASEEALTCSRPAAETCLGVDYEGTGLAICRDEATGIPRFELDGGFRVGVPANLLAVDDPAPGESATVSISACGGIAYEADPCAVEPLPCPAFCGGSCSPARYPELSLDGFQVGPMDMRLGGSGDGGDGILVSEASLAIQNLSSLFTPDDVRLELVFTGEIFFEGADPDSLGVGFGLQGASFAVTQSGIEFNVVGVSASAENVIPVEGIDLDVTRAELHFLDEADPLPLFGPVQPGSTPCEDPADNGVGEVQLRKLAPCNLELTLSGVAGLSFGEGSSIGGIAAAVDELVLVYDEATQAMIPDLTQLRGLGFGIEDIEVPPMVLSGKLYLGGIGGPPQNYYLAGTLGGMYNGMGIMVDTALSVRSGPIGFCLDVETGTGISIGYGFMFIGARGGVVLPRDPGESFTDPCDFVSDYFGPDGSPELDPPDAAEGGEVLASFASEKQGAAISWEGFAQLQDEHRERLEIEERVTSSGATGAVQGGAELFSSSAGASGGGADTCEIDLDAPLEFAACPPPAISLECQPHPDTGQWHSISHDPANPLYDPEYFQRAVIVKFTSFEEARVDELLELAGVTPGEFKSLCEGSPDIGAELADLALTMLAGDWQLPDDPALSEIRALLDAQLAAARDVLADVIRTHIPTCDETNEALLDALYDLAYLGVPCPQMALKLEGTFSYAAVSTFASVTGGFTAAGSALAASGAGLQGSVNVMGIPVGTALAYYSATDAQGLPNPGLCGNVHVGLGPVEFGSLDAAFECPGCQTGQMAAIANLGSCFVGNAAGQEALCRSIHRVILAPEAALLGFDPPVFDPTCDADAQLGELLTAQPYRGQTLSDEERFNRFAAILGTLAEEGAAALGASLPGCFAGLLQDSWDSFNPRLAVGGQAQVNVFGFPVTPDIASVKMLVEKDACSEQLQMVAEYGFSASAMLRAMNAVFALNPIEDYGTMGVSYAIPNALEFLQGSLGGAYSSPEAIASYARASFDDFIDNSTFTGSLALAPFGIPMGGPGGVGVELEGRLILPDLLDHPAFNGFEPDLDADLPRRQELLLATLETPGLLSNPLWKGDGGDLHVVYPAEAPEYTQLQTCGPLDDRPCTLRKDFFPHGGLVGTGVMRLPRLLTDPPPLGLMQDVLAGNVDLPGLMGFLDTYLTGDDVLQQAASLAFYFPGPNPPGLPVLEGGAVCTDLTLCRRELLDSISAFDVESELASLYPFDLVFFEGDFDGTLLGVPVAEGHVSLELPDSPIEPSGTFRVDFSSSSLPCSLDDEASENWLGCFLPGGASLSFLIQQDEPPQLPMVDRFVAIESFTEVGPAVAAFNAELASEMPKVSLNAAVDVGIPAAFSGLLQASADASTTLDVYSPGFGSGCDALAPDADVLSRVQCTGGGVLTGAFDLLAELPGGSGVQVLGSLPEARLAVVLDAAGRPTLSGEMGPGTLGIGPVVIGDASFAFTTGPDPGAPIIAGAGSLQPLFIGASAAECASTGLCVEIKGAGGGALAASFELLAPVAPDTFARTAFTADPAEIRFPFLGPNVSAQIHGCSSPACDDPGDTALPFSYTDTGAPWSAGVSFGQNVELAMPTNPNVPLASLASLDGLPVLRGSITGDGQSFPTMTAELNANAQLVLFEGEDGEVTLDVGAGGGRLTVNGDGSWSLVLHSPRVRASDPSNELFRIEQSDVKIAVDAFGVQVSVELPTITLFPGEPLETVLPSPFSSCSFDPAGMTCRPDPKAIDELQLPGLGGVLPISGDLDYAKGMLTGSFDSRAMRYPDDGHLVTISSATGSFRFSGDRLIAKINTPTITLFGQAVPGVIAGDVIIAYRSANNFSVDLETESPVVMLPGMLELGDGEFALAVAPGSRETEVSFSFDSIVRVAELPSPTGSDWLSEAPMLLTGGCTLPLDPRAPYCGLTGRLDFDSVQTLFAIPGVMELRSLASGSRVEVTRDARSGAFGISAAGIEAYVLGNRVGEFGTSFSAGAQRLRFFGAPDPIDIGAFRLEPSGSLYLDLVYNGFDSTASVQVPGGVIKVAPGRSIPGWPSKGVSFSGFTMAEDGSFSASAGAVFDLDGLELLSGTASLDRSATGVTSFEVDGFAAPMAIPGFGSFEGSGGGNVLIEAYVASSGAVSFGLGPAKLDLGVLGLQTTLNIYGSNPSQPFAFSTRGSWSATIGTTALEIDSPVGEVLDLRRVTGFPGNVFTAGISGVGLGSLSFSGSSTDSVRLTLLQGSPLETGTNYFGAGDVALTLTSTGNLTVVADPGTMLYSDLFSISTGRVTLSASASRGVSVSLTSPSITLFEGTAFEQTVSASACTASPTQFSCGSSSASLNLSAHLGNVNLNGSLDLTPTGFDIGANFGSLSFPTSGSNAGDFLIVNPGSAALKWDGSQLRLETSNPSASVLGFPLSASQISDLDFVMERNGAFQLGYSTYSFSFPALFGNPYILRMADGAMTLRRTSSGVFEIDGLFDLRLRHSILSGTSASTTSFTPGVEFPFTFKSNTTFTYDIPANRLPTMDLDFFKLYPDSTTGDLRVQRTSGGAVSVQARNWVVELFGQKVTNRDFFIGSDGTTGIPISGRTFDLGALRFVTSANTSVNWDANSTGSANLKVVFPTQNLLDLDGVSGLVGDLASGMDLPSFTLERNGVINPSSFSKSSFDINYTSFGTVSVDLNRAAGRTTSTTLDISDTRNGLTLDCHASSGSSSAFYAEVSGSLSLDLNCDHLTPPFCGGPGQDPCQAPPNPLCAVPGRTDPLLLGSIDTSLDTGNADFSFQGSASAAGIGSVDVELGDDGFGVCAGPICGGFSWSW